ncbi:sulfatase-like hydrolase/transferase [Horticoccus sp. 23ND18S-11]|uniref:sulfatase-like hydrolase/transferase n=1 Tax=Horticoccus sp. 23ND18S-11 TaxID=3391832 RepID=UPI0039C8C632
MRIRARLHSITVAALVLGTVAVAAAGAADAATRPNVVFILADDLRPDALAFSGQPGVATPAIDALARRGAVFTRATCGYPICHVSRSEMFTGRTLLERFGRPAAGGAGKFDPAWTLWAEHLRRAGWNTVYSGKWHVAGTPRAAGFAATAGLFSSGGAPAGVKATHPVTPTGRAVTGYTGWTFKNEHNEPQPEFGVGLTPATDRIIADHAVAAIQRQGPQPFFLQVNFTAPHDPLHWPEGHANERDARDQRVPANFRPAPEFDTGNRDGRDERVVPAPRTADDVKRERAIYFSLVENLDRQVGRILAALAATGALERTIVIVSSDHGLALGSHGLMGKQNQYEHTINVPLILAGPGVPAGQRFAGQCALRDLYPTICALTGLDTPASVEGRSLAPILRGQRDEVHDAIFGYFTDTQRMVRTPDGWKLIWYPAIGRYQLFEVGTDPEELRDRIAEPSQQPRVAQLKARLVAWQQQHGDPILASAPKSPRP